PTGIDGRASRTGADLNAGNDAALRRFTTGDASVPGMPTSAMATAARTTNVDRYLRELRCIVQASVSVVRKGHGQQ
ncbi:MAG: hypothetical protein JWN67_564, partial [Actinomycetia bacterium]|nr:hypothetical protein [Actinomycetes bacterium]